MSRQNLFEGLVAVVTGASRGIGKGVADALREQGASVVSISRSAPQGPDALLNYGMDVRNPEHWSHLKQWIEQKFGRWDILVNNAGISGRALGPVDPETVSFEHWSEVIETNLTGTFLGSQAAIAVMKKSFGGSIVNIGSRSGLVARPDVPAYCSSKAAVRHLTKVLAVHCRDKGYKIRCNCVNPGNIKTEIWNALASVNTTDFGEIKDVVRTVLFLCSPEASYLTGTEINVDGGLAARGAS